MTEQGAYLVHFDHVGLKVVVCVIESVVESDFIVFGISFAVVSVFGREAVVANDDLAVVVVVVVVGGGGGCVVICVVARVVFIGNVDFGVNFLGLRRRWNLRLGVVRFVMVVVDLDFGGVVGFGVGAITKDYVITQFIRPFSINQPTSTSGYATQPWFETKSTTSSEYRTFPSSILYPGTTGLTTSSEFCPLGPGRYRGGCAPCSSSFSCGFCC